MSGTWWEWTCRRRRVRDRTRASHADRAWQRQIADTWSVVQLGHLVEVTVTAAVNNYHHWQFVTVIMHSSTQRCAVTIGVPQSPGFDPESEWDSWLRAHTTLWLYIVPSTTRFQPVCSSCRSCYLKRVLSSCHFVAAHTVGAVLCTFY